MTSLHLSEPTEMEWCSILNIAILHTRIEAMLLFLRKTATGYNKRI
jgi:hypothetical protein